MQPHDYMIAAYLVTLVLLGGLVVSTIVRARRVQRAIQRQDAPRHEA